MTFGSTGQTSSILGINKTLLVALIMILVVGSVVVVASTLFIVPSLYTTKTKAFTPYSTGVTLRNNISSLRVINVDGDLNITSWSQPNVFINGTVTVRGLNPNPDAITFTESNASGFILFQANFPSSPLLFSPSYVVDINAYVPRNPNLVYVAASTGNGNIRASSLNVGNSGLGFSVNNGKLSASNITASDVDFTVTNGILSALNITASGASSGVGLSVMNGSIDLVCSASCDNVAAITTNGAITAAFSSLSDSGVYTFSSTNGNIDLRLPASGSFKITANTTNGGVTSSGLAVQLADHVQSTIGSGTATVNATTTNGSITVTGTWQQVS